MDNHYGFQNQWEESSEKIGWWFILLSTAILWLSIYLAASWLWS